MTITSIDSMCILEANEMGTKATLVHLCYLYSLMLMEFKPHPTSITLSLLLIFCGKLSLFISYALLMRPKKAKRVVHGANNQVQYIIMVALRKSTTKVTKVHISVSSS